MSYYITYMAEFYNAEKLLRTKHKNKIKLFKKQAK